MSDRINTINILGYDVSNSSKEFFSAGFRGVVNTLSPHSFIIARKDHLFRKALKTSDFIIPDGVGIIMAARILKGEKMKKIAGYDLHEIIISSLDKRKGSCFYLGSGHETLLKIIKKHSNEHPSLRVGVFSPPYKTIFNKEDNTSMIKVVNDFNPDVLFVGMTAPKQEKWVYENKYKINAPVICCIGAVFDFYAGIIRRPGKFWISLGLEWLPRLFGEPRRLWRRTFISTPLFICLVLREKLSIRKSR